MYIYRLLTTTVYMMAVCRVVLLFMLVCVTYVYKTDAGTHVVFSLKLINVMKHEP
jgi:hypothetical protein